MLKAQRSRGFRVEGWLWTITPASEEWAKRPDVKGSGTKRQNECKQKEETGNAGEG